MKHLPLKLGIGVVLLFAAVIAACLLWTPVKIRYYSGNVRSLEAREISLGLKGLINSGQRGKGHACQMVTNILGSGENKSKVHILDAIMPLGKQGRFLISQKFSSSEEENFFFKYWENADKPINEDKLKAYPLHYAAGKGYLFSVKMFLAKGIDPEPEDQYKSIPILYAVTKCGFRLDWNEEWRKFIDAEKSNHIAIIQELIACKAKIDGEKYNLDELLGAAVITHVEDVARFLIGKGADVNPKKYPPLVEAAYHSRIELIRMIVENGASVNAVDEQGITALMNAAKGRNYPVAEYLISKNAKVNMKDFNGWTALHYSFQNMQIVKLLISSGAIVNAQGNYGRTPLDRALGNHNKEMETLFRSLGGKTREDLKASGVDKE
jgi:ankyrin repeat protein